MTEGSRRAWREGGNGAVRPEWKTPYERWMDAQGIPIVEGFGVTDLAEPKFAYWDHIGCEAYFVQLNGMEGFTSGYVAQVPAGGSTKLERHLYEKVIFILTGTGSTVLEAQNSERVQFEWHEGSLFAIPLNTPHRLFAHGDPVRYVAFTTAVVMFDLLHNEEFIHNTPFLFRDRFDGTPEFLHKDLRTDSVTKGLFGQFGHRGWETNFVPDTRVNLPDEVNEAKHSLRFIQYELAGNSLIVHQVKFPSGSYMQAHHHGGGAVLLILNSEGYSLMWPKDLGHQPFENGYGDEVVRVDWKRGSIFSPPTAWYHQHFNTGTTDALQLAIRYGSEKNRLGIWNALGGGQVDGRSRLMMTRKEGGAVIEYAEEDPEINRLFNEEIARNGVAPWVRH